MKDSSSDGSRFIGEHCAFRVFASSSRACLSSSIANDNDLNSASSVEVG